MKIKSLLKDGVTILSARDTALLDCEVLLAYVLGKNREAILSNPDKEVDAPLANLFMQYVRRVADGEPVAYIRQEKEFYGLIFFVDKRVLVPRPETELLIDKILDYLRRDCEGRKFRMLDVGTGSGNIAVSVAKAFSDDEIDQIDAVDINEEALEVAKINVQQHGLEDKVHIYQGDLLEYMDDGEQYDVIAANLPYIGEEKNRFISADVEKHEPKAALFGGCDGLRLYERMFQQISDKSIDYGIIVGEFGFAQSEDMEKLLSKYFDQKWSIERDLAGIERIFIIKK